MKRLVAATAVLTCIVLAGGCRRTPHSEKTYDLTPNNLTVADLPAAKTLTADYASADNVPVRAVLVKSEDATTALDAVKSGKSLKEALALVKPLSEQPVQASGKLTSPRTDDATKYSILFTTDKATTVTVKTKGE